MLLRLWSSAKPECYNVKGLKRVLAAEGLHHMWLWISLMTQRQPHSVVSKKVQESNSSRANTYTTATTATTVQIQCQATPVITTPQETPRDQAGDRSSTTTTPTLVTGQDTPPTLVSGLDTSRVQQHLSTTGNSLTLVSWLKPRNQCNPPLIIFTGHSP